MQLTDKHKVATPADWKVNTVIITMLDDDILLFLIQPGDSVMIQPTVPDEEVATLFPQITIVALPSGKGYMRKTPQP